MKGAAASIREPSEQTQQSSPQLIRPLVPRRPIEALLPFPEHISLYLAELIRTVHV